MIITVAITTVVWLAVTFLTKPESTETLVSFYRRTAPSVDGLGTRSPRLRLTFDRAGMVYRTCWIGFADAS